MYSENSGLSAQKFEEYTELSDNSGLSAQELYEYTELSKILFQFVGIFEAYCIDSYGFSAFDVFDVIIYKQTFFSFEIESVQQGVKNLRIWL